MQKARCAHRAFVGEGDDFAVADRPAADPIFCGALAD
ncbi:hypothetical protein U716_10355 [Rhodobacter capsulatus B6]|nr:hypothetical protein U716_10355 [Rhodobacter capsulatus B6]